MQHNIEHPEAGSAFTVAVIGLVLTIIIVAPTVKIGSAINNYWNVSRMFDTMAKHLKHADADAIRNIMPLAMEKSHINPELFPDAFYYNLDVSLDDRYLKISSTYFITFWMIGEPISIDPYYDYKANGYGIARIYLDKILHKFRWDMHFTPYGRAAIPVDYLFKMDSNRK
ncbi:MAG: hypothetical protein R8L53_04655 [Mariprofundales bacterium]